MPTNTVLKVAGLHTAASLQAPPEGTLLAAENVVIRSPNIVEPRRGQGRELESFPGAGSAHTFAFYDGSRLVHYGADKLAYFTDVYNDYSGTYPAVDTQRMKFAEANKNLYFNTANGTKVVDKFDATPRPAGMASPSDVQTQATTYLLRDPDATRTWLPVDSQVGYRATLSRKDTNSNIIESAPNGRLVVTNPADFTASLQRVSNVVTGTVTGSHLLRVGDRIRVATADASFGAGPHTVTAVTATTFTYTHAGSNAGPANHTITSGTKAVKFRFRLPPGLTPDHHYYRIYRTPNSAGEAVDPGDEHFLVYENYLTSADISNGYVEFEDYAPEGALSATPLYTNPRTGDGILSANHQPPIGVDIAEWQGRLWVANTTEKHRFPLQLVGIGPPAGLSLGDMIVIGGVSFIASTAEDVDYGAFKFFDNLPTISANIEATARSLVSIINAIARNHPQVVRFRAAYASGDNDPPGMIMLEETEIGGEAFYLGASVSSASAWNPTLPKIIVTEGGAFGYFYRFDGVVYVDTPGGPHGYSVGDKIVIHIQDTIGAPNDFSSGVKTITAVPGPSTLEYEDAGPDTDFSDYDFIIHSARPEDGQVSENGRAENKLMYSKALEPEAVPLVNYLYVGARNKAILRIVPLRDRLLVFKEEGVYVVSGEPPWARVDLLDGTAWLTAPDTVASVNNRVYCLTNKGVAAINEAGVVIVSEGIRDLIVDVGLANINIVYRRRYAWGASRESEGFYLLGLPTSGTASNDVYVYNTNIGTWFHWPIARRFAAVDPSTDLLWLASISNHLLTERRDYLATDYSDDDVQVSVAVPSSGDTVTLSSASAAGVGDVLYQGSKTHGSQAVITAINGNTVTLHRAQTYVDGTPAFLAKRFASTVIWAPANAGAVNLSKQFRELTLHFSDRRFLGAQAFTRTDFDKLGLSSIRGYQVGNVYSPGAGTRLPRNVRLLVPLEQQRGQLLYIGFHIDEAWGSWQLNGYSLEFDIVSQRTMQH